MGGTRRAVVIGIDKYQAPRIGELSGAVRDATEICEILKQNDNFKIEPQHFLTDQRATADNIRAAISDVFYKTEEPCELALFYFSGHGRKDYLDYGYLLPHDCDHTAPFVRGIRIQELKQLFLHPKLNIETAIMILDCCYSGIATQTRGDPDEEANLESFREELRLESAGSGRFILASARADEAAREKKQKHAFSEEEAHVHGLYSFHVIEGLRAGACDDFGCVSLGALIKYINEKFDESDAKHKPQHYGVGTGEFRIELARRPEILEQALEKRYLEVVSLIATNQLKTLLYSIERLEEIKELGDKHRISQCYNDIREGLDHWADNIYSWWAANDLEINAKAQDSPGYEKLNEVLSNFTLETITTLSKKEKGFLGHIIEAILNNLTGKAQDNQSVQSIVSYIRRFDRNRSDVPSITSPNVAGHTTA
jgi:uncharacterized caspase-like protein